MQSGNCVKHARLDPGWNEAKARPQARLLDIENQLATNKFEQISAPHYDGIYIHLYLYLYLYFFRLNYKKHDGNMGW